jgi:LPS O-antigen subunit length determinant protein (WzzB/FepE family)
MSGDTERAEEISVVDIARCVWAGKYWVALSTVTCALVGLSYALVATQIYQADVVVVNAERQTGAGSVLAQLGGLANLAGLGNGPKGGVEPVVVLKSKGFARRFIEARHLEQLLASSSGHDGADPIDIRDAVDSFDKSVRFVDDDKRSGLITVSIRWKDPATAADWANDLIARANDELRNQAEQEATKNLRFLQGELASTNIVSLQQAIGRLMESEMQKAMIAKGNREFAFKVIDSASAPKYRFSPRRKLVLLFSASFGFVASVLVIVARRTSKIRQR